MRLSLAARAAAAALGVLGAACGGDDATCAEARLPDTQTRVPWVSEVDPIVEVQVAGRTLRLLLDTGYAQSALTVAAASGLALSEGLDVALGGAQLEAVRFGLLVAPVGLEGILGGDVLHRLPFVLDPSTRTTSVLPAFSAPGDGDVRLEWDTAVLCQGEAAETGLSGFAGLPRVPLRLAEQEEAAEVFLDTGATFTFLASSRALDKWPRLNGLPVVSGFAGAFTASATRPPSQTVGALTVLHSPVLSAPELDALLPSGVTGFLGWSTLRHARLDLSVRGENGEPFLRLQPSGGPPPPRDFVGVGLVVASVTEGLRVQAVLSPSPASEAALQAGDVLTHVDGVSPPTPDHLNGPLGGLRVLRVRRGAEEWELSLRIADLLPDAP